jgi:hypothetical protein
MAGSPLLQKEGKVIINKCYMNSEELHGRQVSALCETKKNMIV